MGKNKFDMDIENCDPKSVFLNLTTGGIECLPGVLIPPAGYSQLAPEVTVKPKPQYWKYALGVLAIYYLIKK